MKRLIFVLLLLSVPACAGNSQPQLTAQGQAAVTAAEVVKGLDVIRDTAQAVLSPSSARIVTLFHESAVQVIAAVPSGWKPTVLAAFDQLQKDLPASDWTRISPYITLAKTLIASVV